MPMKLTKFKIMTFDVVGTLIDFEKGVLDSVRSLGGTKAAKACDDEIFEPYKRGEAKFCNHSFLSGMKDVYLSLAAESGFDADESKAVAFQLGVLRWPAFPDSVAALVRLRRHFRLVAMTNVDRISFSAYAHTLGHPFDDSITHDDTQCLKPDPQFFAFNQGRQSAFGFKQSEILHVAQSQYHDIGVAKSLGYATCWIERRQGKQGFGGTPVPDSIVKPDFHFSSLIELADAVEAEITITNKERNP